MYLKYFIFIFLVTAEFIVIRKSVLTVKFTQMLYRFLEIKLLTILAPLPNHMTTIFLSVAIHCHLQLYQKWMNQRPREAQK